MKKTKLLSLILAMLMLTSSVFAAPVALPTVDSAQETEEAAQQHFPAAEAEVGAESLPKFKPGINILTGTKEALDFDGAEFEAGGSSSNGVFYDDNGNDVLKFDTAYLKKVAVVASPVTGETDNKALKLSNYVRFLKSNFTSYPTIKFDNYEAPEAPRPVFVSFNSIVDNTDYLLNPKKNATSSGLRLQLRGTTTPWNGPHAVNCYFAADTPSEWKKITVKDEIEGRKNLAHISFYAKIDQKYADNKEYAYVEGGNYYLKKQEYEPNHYLDDIMYVPYYKVTYKDGDKLVGEKYVLDDGKGNILTEFDPYTQGVALPENKSGWALTPNGKPVTSVALNNKDITLHAVTEYMDKTVAFFDFSSQDNIKEWSFPKFENDKGILKAADVVTSSDETNPLVGAENAVKAKVWLEEKKDGTLAYDAQIQLEKKMKIPAASINVIEIRAKAENVTQIVNPSNKTETIPATLDDRDAELYLHIEESNQYYKKAMKWKDATKDENGWYTFTFETDALKPVDSANTTTWDQVVTNGYNVDILRFDPSNTDGTFYIDYIKLYGKTNDITPIAPYAPENIDGVSFRVDPGNAKTTGVRFRASMLNTTRENTSMTEYGWIVALEETLGVQELTHEFDAKARVEGKAFSRAKDSDKIVKDKIFDANENSTIFSAVVTGIPVQFADKVLAIRPYSFMNGGYIYGKTVLISPREVAQRVKDNDSDFYEKNKDYIDSLLGTSQEEAE